VTVGDLAKGIPVRNVPDQVGMRRARVRSVIIASIRAMSTT